MTYLYFILPPVIIVIVTALILYLLSRKSFGGEKSEKRKKIIKTKSSASKKSLVGVQEGFLNILEKGAHGLKGIFAKLHGKFGNLLGSIKVKAKKKGDFSKDSGIFERSVLKDEQEKAPESIAASNKKEGIKKRIGPIIKRKKKEDKEGRVEERFKRRGEGIIRKSWRQTVDFSRSSRKLKSSVLSREEKKESKGVAKVENEKEKEKNEAPMVSKEVVYPEARIMREKNENIEKMLVERIASDPRDVEAYEKLGNYYEERKSYDDALSCFKYVLKLNPESKRAERKVMKIQDLMSR